jgi:integrase
MIKMEEAPAIKPVFTIEAENKPVCPECGSERLYKDGLRYLADGSKVQRFLCRTCGYRFTWPRVERQNLHRGKNLKSRQTITFNECSSRALALLEQSVRGPMSVEEKNGSGLAGAATPNQTSQMDVKGKILEFLWHLQKQGYSMETVKFYNRVLRTMSQKTNLLDGEAVKEALAKMPISETTKCNYAYALQSFYKHIGIEWNPPKYKPQKTLPFIPTEQELNLLISNTSKNVSAALQLLKETGARIGEILKLKWTDIDFERKNVRITPEKGSLPRILPISDLAISMIKRLKPRQDGRIFSSRKNLLTAFYKQRKRLAHKLQNPRLLQISFHTFRHWKGTMEYHKTRDILHVQRLLGHKNIQNTLIYVNIEQALFQNTNEEFHVATARTVEEACRLVELGFEYVTDMDGIKIFRKRK